MHGKELRATSELFIAKYKTEARSLWVGLISTKGRREGMTAQPLDQLSPREYQVAALVALALTDQQIAKSLFISVSTVKAHIASVKSKLGLSNRTAVCRWMLVSHYEGKIILFDNVL